MLELFLTILFILISFALLLKGADVLVEGAADLARWMKISPMLVGLTVVAFGTSLPELMVSLFAAFNHSPDLSVGNIIGSNIFNIAAIIGISAILRVLVIRSKTLAYEFPFLIAAAFMLLILGTDWFIFQQPTFTLSRFDGLIFLVIFAIFIYYIYLCARKDQERNGKKASDKKKAKTKSGKEAPLVFKAHQPLWKDSLFIVGGLMALVVGGRLFSYAAGKLALLAGISEAFIGLTIAAIGTSLPELATSAVAAWKKEGDIAIGNIVGSNIFNILFVLGIVSIIQPLAVSPAMLAIDGMVMIFISGLFLFFAARYGKISRSAGAILLLSYVLYFGWLVWNV